MNSKLREKVHRVWEAAYARGRADGFDEAVQITERISASHKSWVHPSLFVDGVKTVAGALRERAKQLLSGCEKSNLDESNELDE